jgi:hypothetical protein
MIARSSLFILSLALWAATGPAAPGARSGPRGAGSPVPAVRLAGAAGVVPTIDQAVASKRDLWGEAALRQPGGPNYEFFAKLLPPLRYVDAPFHYYPIVLSAPGAPVKARLVSNGGTLNALARQPNWRGEAGVPVTFRVGRDGALFGDELSQLDGPKYRKGFLPVIELRYRHGDSVYREEAFAGVEPELARDGVVFLRFSLESGAGGKVAVQFEGPEPWNARSGMLQDAGGKTVASFDTKWEWNLARNTLTAQLALGEGATLAVAVLPVATGLPRLVDARVYGDALGRCEARWEALLGRGMQVEVPEAVVENAWRALLAGSYGLLKEDEIRYSAGNQYAKLYIGEGGDAARSFLLWGHAAEARRMIQPLFDYTRKGLEYHQAAFKLQMLAHYYWMTRDAEILREHRGRVEKELNAILGGIEPESGLLPREKYCGDIDTRVYSLNSNANCWRALRDMAAVLAEAGDRPEADRLAARAMTFRKAILVALEKSERRDVAPHFVPVALFGEESPYDPVTGSRMGSYWNLMAPYVLGSGLFRFDSEPATAIIEYVQQKGGLCMGMIRSRPNPTFWVDVQNINHLYGLRYTLALLQRDEPDQALVNFYGLLAQGFTRDTLIGAEGTSIRPLDNLGRQMYLPPNSAANAHFLWALRNLLVQDWDMDDDGRPDTLRLLFATPRGWLRDGASLSVSRAPTAFGTLSLHLRSELRKGQVTVEVDLPPRRASRTFLRLRLPGGWRVAGGEANGTALPLVGPETLDLTGASGRMVVHARAQRVRA